MEPPAGSTTTTNTTNASSATLVPSALDAFEFNRHTEDGFSLTDLAHVHDPIDPRVHDLPSSDVVAEGLSHIFHHKEGHHDGTQSTGSARLREPVPIKEIKEDEPIYVEYEHGDPRNPFNFSYTRKWAITFALVIFTAISAATGSSFPSGYPSMMADLHCSQELAALGLSLYALGFGLAPLVLASFSEEFGRLPMYLVSSVIFTLFFLPIALAQNIQTVLISRFIQGAAGSTGSTLVGGTLADIWVTSERGLPMSMFSLMALLCTGLGPVVVGYIELDPRLGWRWIQWLGLIVGGVISIGLCVILKETRASIILTRAAKKLRHETGDNRYRARVEDERASLKTLVYISFTRPLFLLCTEPVVASFSLWVGFAWGMLYCLLESVPYVFGTIYGFNAGQLGLAFIALCIGTLIGWASNFYQEKLYRENVARRGPEARLYSACVAGVLFPVGAFIYAWTSFSNVHWIAPLIGITVITTAIFMIYLSVFSYLADSYLIFASSALAGQSLSRNLMATAFPLFTITMYERLTPQWASTLVGFLAAALGVIPFVLFFWGAKVRERSRFAKKMAAMAEDS